MMTGLNPIAVATLNAVGYKLVDDINGLSEFTNGLQGDIIIDWVNKFDENISDDASAFPCYVKYQEWVTYDSGNYEHRFQGITPAAILKSLEVGHV